MDDQRIEAAARRVYLFFRDARRQSEAWADHECDYVNPNADVTRFNQITWDRGLDATAESLLIDAVAAILRDEIGAAEKQRDALFSLLCRRGRNRWWPLRTVGTEAEALAFDGFATREEAMEALVRWGEAGVIRSESEDTTDGL